MYACMSVCLSDSLSMIMMIDTFEERHKKFNLGRSFFSSFSIILLFGFSKERTVRWSVLMQLKMLSYCCSYTITNKPFYLLLFLYIYFNCLEIILFAKKHLLRISEKPKITHIQHWKWHFVIFYKQWQF